MLHSWGKLGKDFVNEISKNQRNNQREKKNQYKHSGKLTYEQCGHAQGAGKIGELKIEILDI